MVRAKGRGSFIQRSPSAFSFFSLLEASSSSKKRGSPASKCSSSIRLEEVVAADAIRARDAADLPGWGQAGVPGPSEGTGARGAVSRRKRFGAARRHCAKGSECARRLLQRKHHEGTSERGFGAERQSSAGGRPADDGRR